MVLEDIDVIANKIRRYLQDKIGLDATEEYFVLEYVKEDVLSDVHNALFASDEEEDFDDDEEEDIFDKVYEGDDEGESDDDEEDEVDEDDSEDELDDEDEEGGEDEVDERGSEMEMPLEDIPPPPPPKKKAKPAKDVPRTKYRMLKEAGEGKEATDVIKKPKFLMRPKKEQEEVDAGDY